MKNLLVASVVLVVTGTSFSTLAADKTQLTLDEAISLAVNNSPDTKGAEAMYGAAKGERQQAGVLPNPTLGLDAENIGGSGAYSGSRNAELTLGVSQLIQIGGKRSAAISAADKGQLIAYYGQSLTKLDLIRNVKVAFAEAVAAQEQAKVLQYQTKLAYDVYANVSKRVNAAAEPQVQRNKAKISLANAELILERAKGQRSATTKILSSLLSNAITPVSLASKDFYKAEKPEVVREIEGTLKSTPDYKQQTASLEQANSLLDLEYANAIPDPTVSVGLRELRSTNDQALVIGISMPMPVFNVNRGNIQKAQNQAVKASTDRQRTLLQGQASFAEHTKEMTNAWLTATRLKNDILPQAQESFRLAQQGYNTGRLPYLEVLDAQRTLADTRISYIQALLDYHVNKAEIERLIALDNDFKGEKK